MFDLWTRVLLGMAVIVLLATGVTNAQEEEGEGKIQSIAAEMDDWEQCLERLNSLEKEVSHLRQQQRSSDVDYMQCVGDDGFYAGLELTLLEAHVGTVQIRSIQPANLTPDFENELAPRITVGHEDADGIGSRIQWWSYDHHATGATLIGDLVGGPISLRLDVDSVDFERTQKGLFCNWEFQLGAGFRYGRIETQVDFSALTFSLLGLDVDIDEPLGAGVTFEGLGPTVSFEARRPLKRFCGFTSYVNGRMALLYGDTRVGGTGAAADLINPLGLKVNEHFMQTTALAAGLERRRAVRDSTLILRIGYEGQVWDWGSILSIIEPEVGFVGPTMTLTLLRSQRAVLGLVASGTARVRSERPKLPRA